MKKTLSTISLILVFIIALSVCSCSTKRTNNKNLSSNSALNEKISINIATLSGPTAIGMLNLMGENKKGKAENNYNFEVFTSADQVVPQIINKSIDIAAIPTNLAATLYKKTEKNISIIAVNTLGVLSVVTNNDEIKSISDLKGKTVYITGQGATPEYAFKYILEKNGLTTGSDLKIEYKSEHAELASLMISNKVDVAVLPQPFTTNVIAKNKDMKIAVDLSQEWEKVSGGNQLVMGCLIVRNDFLNKNKDAVNTFLSEYAKSTEKANNNPVQTAKYSDEFNILPSDIVKKCIPDCNIVCITGNEIKKNVSEYFKILYNFNPLSIGGEIPDDNLYYKQQ